MGFYSNDIQLFIFSIFRPTSALHFDQNKTMLIVHSAQILERFLFFLTDNKKNKPFFSPQIHILLDFLISHLASSPLSTKK